MLSNSEKLGKQGCLNLKEDREQQMMAKKLIQLSSQGKTNNRVEMETGLAERKTTTSFLSKASGLTLS